MEQANIISYLMSRAAPPPHLTYKALDEFLSALGQMEEGYWILPSTELGDTISNWANKIRRKTSGPQDKAVKEADLQCIFTPTFPMLGELDICASLVGTSKNSDAAKDAINKAVSGHPYRILTLLPGPPEPNEVIHMADPDNGFQSALDRRDLWPGVVISTPTGRSTFLPLEEASTRIQHLWTTRGYGDFEDPDRWEERTSALTALTQPSSTVERRVNRRLLHLSDLHFGTKEAAAKQGYLAACVARELRGEVDQIVITGDLFNHPIERYARRYKAFSHSLHLLSGRQPIEVPGNHDQRFFGNALSIFGRRMDMLADFDLRPRVQVDHEARIIFFCFDSNRIGSWAKGRVSDEQLLSMARDFQAMNRNGRLKGYRRVALVHHHPYPYPSQADERIVNPLVWRGHEKFVALEGAAQFLEWCASRHISLILHGHKHIPRLIVDAVEIDGGNGGRQRIITAGCGSSMAIHSRQMSFNVIDWNPELNTWSVKFRIDMDGRGFQTARMSTLPPERIP
ncbi:metallophosphoesterase [Streptomyces coeruleofuscus]